jgi:crotonobetainyl-CoA:carnitine CoA-transferase CaiB-like acyl-CoA transferase
VSGPLSGVRVVDFSRVLAGPLCARTLLDLGAEVIKIEPPGPDVSRFAFPSTPGMSGYYAQQNAGKRNVSIDLNVPGARELALRLCDTADVVVENFRAGTLRHFGLDYETLAARNPRLIYASITGYGQGGPWQGRMAYAPTVQAEAGFTHNSLRHYGEALGEPRTDGLSHADVYAGLQAAVAILAALHRRTATGTGQYIDVAMAATLMAVNERAHVDLNGAELGDEPAILGATDCPFFIGPGGENFTVATSLVGSRTFPSWLRAMRRADLADDPRFATAATRRANFAELHRIVQNWILTFADVGALDAQLDEAKIAFGEVRSLKQLSEMEWAEYWDAVQEVSDRSGGSYRLPGRPWRFSRERLAPLGEPAYQGEHNRAVFAELGFSDEQIGGYVASGALVSALIPQLDRTDGEDLSPEPAHQKGQRHDQQYSIGGQHDGR